MSFVRGDILDSVCVLVGVVLVLVLMSLVLLLIFLTFLVFVISSFVRDKCFEIKMKVYNTNRRDSCLRVIAYGKAVKEHYGEKWARPW